MNTHPKTPEQEFAERVIADLGGTSATAKLCKTSLSAISQWKENGIPDYRLDFLKLARPDVFEALEREDHPATPPAAQAH